MLRLYNLTAYRSATCLKCVRQRHYFDFNQKFRIISRKIVETADEIMKVNKKNEFQTWQMAQKFSNSSRLRTSVNHHFHVIASTRPDSPATWPTSGIGIASSYWWKVGWGGGGGTCVRRWAGRAREGKDVRTGISCAQGRTGIARARLPKRL